MMEWNHEAIDAAQTALKTVNDAIDLITLKATQLESLLVLLAHSSPADDAPDHHRLNVCWLGAELAADIRAAAATIG